MNFKVSVIACLGLVVAGAANALTTAELQKLLQSTPRRDTRYEEVRESPWLSSPITTRGVLRVTPQMLEKRVESPRAETWRMFEDRLEWIGPDGARKQVLFSQAPALAALADATRHAVAGNLQALAKDFQVDVRGDDRVWSAHLRPLSPVAMRQLESVELQGSGGQLLVLIVIDRRGERTLTRISP